MKDGEIRTAIAEACGWRAVNPNEKPQTFTRSWYSPNPRDTEARFLPDYPNDLNAMHEAEKTLTQIQIPVYQRHLYELQSADEDWKRTASQRAVHATARQRCEAFLKTLDLWKEDDR